MKINIEFNDVERLDYYFKVISENKGKFNIIQGEENRKKNNIYLLSKKNMPNPDYIMYKFKVYTKDIRNLVLNSLYGFVDNGFNATDHIMGCILPKEQSAIYKGNQQTDFSKEVQEFHRAIYKEKLSFNSKDKEYKLKHGDVDIIVRGDCDFNFKAQHISEYLSMLKSRVTINKEFEMNRFENLLLMYNELMYTPENFSLLPKTGGLNNTKKNIGNDRFDTFIYTLKLYYEGCTAFVLSSGTQKYTVYENHEALKKFLDSFDNVNEFCEFIYHIDDKELIKRLCESGKRAIDSPERLDEYLKLCMEVRFTKTRFYEEKMPREYKEFCDSIVKRNGRNPIKY